jgi:hypothetical protein
MRLEAVGRLAPLLSDGQGRLRSRSASAFMNAHAVGTFGAPTPTSAKF